MQFPATLAQLTEKPPTTQWPDSENILDWIYPSHAICTNFGSAGKKAPLWLDSEKILDWIYLFHVICTNFGSAGRKAHPPPVAYQWNFLDWIYPFHAFSSNFVSPARKAHPSSGQLVKSF